MENEIWLPVKDFEGLYEVSSCGRVRSLEKQKILTLHLDKHGYHYVVLYKNGKQKFCFVHRLVAIAFIPNWNNDPMVNHIDEDKTNNNVCNLEWCDAKYNANHGTAIKRRVENRYNRKDNLKKLTEFILENKDKDLNWIANNNGIVSYRTFINWKKHGLLEMVDTELKRDNISVLQEDINNFMNEDEESRVYSSDLNFCDFKYKYEKYGFEYAFDSEFIHRFGFSPKDSDFLELINNKNKPL